MLLDIASENRVETKFYNLFYLVWRPEKKALFVFNRLWFHSWEGWHLPPHVFVRLCLQARTHLYNGIIFQILTYFIQHILCFADRCILETLASETDDFNFSFNNVKKGNMLQDSFESLTLCLKTIYKTQKLKLLAL